MSYVYIVAEVNDRGTLGPRVVAESEARVVWAKRYQAAFPLERQGCYADHTIGTDFLWVVKVGENDMDDDADDDADDDIPRLLRSYKMGLGGFSWREGRYVNE